MVLLCEDPEGRSKFPSSGIEFTVEGTRTPTAVTWASGFSADGCLRPLSVVGCCPPNIRGGDGHVLGSNFTRALLVDVGLFQRCGYWQLLKRSNSMDHHDNCLHPGRDTQHSKMETWLFSGPVSQYHQSGLCFLQDSHFSMVSCINQVPHFGSPYNRDHTFMEPPFAEVSEELCRKTKGG